MKRFLSVLLLFVFFTPVGTARAEGTSFELSGNFIFEITKDGPMKVRQEVKIKNLTSEHYAPSFTFRTSGFKPENLAAFENGNTTKVEKKEDDAFEVILTHPALGIGKTKTASISFTDSFLSKKRGDVWEARLPRIENINEFKSLIYTIRVPKDISQQLHVFPARPGITKGGFVEYVFTKEDILENTIDAYVGDVAQYRFQLVYPLENTSHFKRDITFAIPPDTAYQEVTLERVSEGNIKMSLDSDGNWIGSVQIPANTTKNIEIAGIVRVFASPREDFPQTNGDVLKLNTEEKDFWEFSNPEIASLSATYTTPSSIYDYVVSTLTYDRAKTTRPQERLGAASALKNPKEALCMEFTDLFVAISRGARVPAREINGYAVTEDKDHPRSLGGDILHSWPEYWNEHTGIWTPTDPTWGNTTGGVNYFSKFDLNHIAFVIHGVQSTMPQTPGTYKSNDPNLKLVSVQVSSDQVEDTPLNVELTATPKGIGLTEVPYEVSITNKGSRALYNKTLQIVANGKTVATFPVVALIPHQKVTNTIQFPLGIFGLSAPKEFTTTFENQTQSVKVHVAVAQFIHLLLLVILPLLVLVTATKLFISKK